MIKLLARLFINDRDNTMSPVVRRAYGIMCGAFGVFLNLLLFTGKLIAGTISGSIAITADAVNNLSDAGASIVSMLGFKLAGQRPDTEHPFGHGRLEYVSGLIVSFFILIMGFELGKSSIEKIISPVKVEYSVLSLTILSVSILVKLYMAFYNGRLGKKLNSPSMRATAMDSRSDCIATAVVLICAIIGLFTDVALDGWCGAAVALFIFVSGIKSAADTISPLLGQSPDPEFVKEIEQTVLANEGVIGIHDLVVHDYGPGRRMISLHAEVRKDADLVATHDTIDNIEKQLRDALECEAIIHMDPIDTDDELTNTTKEKISALVKVIDERVTIHDFRMVSGATHTNVIFDIVVPYDVRRTEDTVRRDVERIVKTLDESYYAVVNVDQAYTK